MEVILLEDIAKLGKRYDVRSVAGGYARNYLIGRGLALVATEKSLQRIKRLKSLEIEMKKESEQALTESLAGLGDFEFKIKQKANEDGHLFGAIRAGDILNLFSEKKINLNEENVVLTAPIKQLGAHQIVLLVGEREFKFKLNVEAESWLVLEHAYHFFDNSSSVETSFSGLGKSSYPIFQSKESVIFSQTDILSRHDDRAALAH